MGATPHPENPHAGQGSVLLDIGGDIGALVVSMPSWMTGEEVEILPAGEQEGLHHPHRQHVAVVNRPVGNGKMASLVFPELVEGSHGLVCKGTDEVLLRVEIHGGEVTSAEWPEP